jgi:flagellin FlaB
LPYGQELEGGEGIKITFIKAIHNNGNAAIGVGSLIIFIAMILVAGITASVLIQTMNSLQEQAMKTGTETIRDVSSGLKVTHISGYNDGSNITQLAIFITPIAASNDLDLIHAYISMSDSSKNVVLNYSSSEFSSTVSNGLFSTLNSSNLSSSTYGILVVRDVDSSCNSTTPIINNGDLVVLLVNTTKCFSGIDKRDEVFGTVDPEFGISGVIGFTAPNAFSNTILDLQP